MNADNFPGRRHLSYRHEDLRKSAMFALATFDSSFLLKPVQIAGNAEISSEANARARLFAEASPIPTLKDVFGMEISIDEEFSPESRGRRRFAGGVRSASEVLVATVGALVKGRWSAFEPPFDQEYKKMFLEDQSGLSIVSFNLEKSRERASISAMDSAAKIPDVTLDYLAEEIEPVRPGKGDEKIRKLVEEMELPPSQKDALSQDIDRVLDGMNRWSRNFRVHMHREILLGENDMVVAPDGSIVPREMLAHSSNKVVAERYEKAIWTYLLDFAEKPDGPNY